MTAFLAVVLATLGVAVGAVRWLRVAQREHYLPRSVSLFAWRWMRIDPLNTTAAAVAVLAVVGVAFGVVPLLAGALVAALFAALAPRGLGWRGTSSALRWTSRLRRLAMVTGALWIAIAVIAMVTSPVIALTAAVVAPFLYDASAAVLLPVERRMGERWVREAAGKIGSVDPKVVAITGSYGKTTTKEYVRLIVGPHLPTVASPASFNNRMGLARAVNEHLSDGTAVFVAEMGTYGPGEIADLCRWIQPDISVITAIGPVHLERFGSLDRTLAAKSEILEGASVAVLNIDDERLARLADQQTDREVVTVSASGAAATVSLTPTGDGFDVHVHGTIVAQVGPVAFPSNFGCAVGVAVALGLPLDGLPVIMAGAALPAHRQTQYVSDAGFVIIDDTYNSNPAGAAAALETLRLLDVDRRVVVTPGMVELGPEQSAANRRFGEEAAATADVVLIVGRTNRAALRQGTAAGSASVMLMPARQDAVDWVKANLGPGDAVLYENDLPDHYP